MDDKNCECSQRLPIHMFRLFVSRPGKSFQHVCSCERCWEIVDGEVICVGTRSNPFKDT